MSQISKKNFIKCSFTGKPSDSFFEALSDLYRIEGTTDQLPNFPDSFDKNMRNYIIDNMFFLKDNEELIELINRRIQYLNPDSETKPQLYDPYNKNIYLDRLKLQLNHYIQKYHYNRLDLQIAKLLKTSLGVLTNLIDTGISIESDESPDVRIKDYIITMFLEDAYADTPEFYITSLVMNRSIYIYTQIKDSEHYTPYYQNIINDKLPIHILKNLNGIYKLLLPNILGKTCITTDSDDSDVPDIPDSGKESKPVDKSDESDDESDDGQERDEESENDQSDDGAKNEQLKKPIINLTFKKINLIIPKKVIVRTDDDIKDTKVDDFRNIGVDDEVDVEDTGVDDEIDVEDTRVDIRDTNIDDDENENSGSENGDENKTEDIADKTEGVESITINKLNKIVDLDLLEMMISSDDLKQKITET